MLYEGIESRSNGVHWTLIDSTGKLSFLFVMLHVQHASLAHGMTGLPEIPSESTYFQWIRWTPSEDFLTLLIVLFTLKFGLKWTRLSLRFYYPLASMFFPLESS